MRRLFSFALLAVGSASAQTTAGSLSVDEVVGCYELTHDEWPAPSPHLPQDPLPQRVELTAERFKIGRVYPDRPEAVEYIDPPGYDHPLYVVRFPDVPPGAGPFSFWRAYGGRLFLGRYLPHTGFALAVKYEDDGLTGALIRFTDVIPEDGNTEEEVGARLTQVGCEQGG